MADPPIVRRLRIVMDQLHTFTSAPPQPGEDVSSAEKYAKYSWFMHTIMDELLDELAERGTDQATIGVWFAKFGRVLEWCGSGDESVLPAEMRAYLVAEEPQLMLAITAGD